MSQLKKTKFYMKEPKKYYLVELVEIKYYVNHIQYMQQVHPAHI